MDSEDIRTWRGHMANVKMPIYVATCEKIINTKYTKFYYI